MPSSFTHLIESEQMGVCVQFYSAGIVRVRKWPMAEGRVVPEKKSYSVIMSPRQKAARKSGENMLVSDLLSVSVDTQTGQLTFSTPDGKPLLTETSTSFEMRRGDADEGKYRVSQTWQLRPEEQIFGLGQLRSSKMGGRGYDIDIWNRNTYTPIPYFTTQNGFGVYWDNAGRSHFKDSPDATTFRSEVGVCADYYFMFRDGSQDGLIDCIRQLTGQATMFPLWTMGHWQCRERYKTSDELVFALDRYRELGIPLDGIVQDWQYWGCDSNWNAMDFMNPYYINKVGDPLWARYLPEDLKALAKEYLDKGLKPRIKSPGEMVGYVHGRNAHLMISIWANFGPWTKPYTDLEKIGALLPFETWPMRRGVKPYDPFNPKARDIYWHYLTTLYNMGLDAWWTDSTEPDHFEGPGDDDVKTHDGTWRSVKNAFPLVTNRGIYEHQREAEAKRIKKEKGYKGRRSVQMTRSGAFGLQHYGTFSWSGDIQASWQEMKDQVASGLNYTLCGIPFWNSDIGGFFYWDYNNDPKNPALQELHTRWMQWGTFMPIMRNHASSPMPSELYHFGNAGDWAYDAQVDAVRLRYRLLPYIYSSAGDCVQRSGSMMRALVMDFPSDTTAISHGDEYMFGRQLLVKPVTSPLYTWQEDKRHGYAIYPDLKKAAAPVDVYLPAGIWYDFFSGKAFEGPRTVQRPTPITEMPVYVRGGSILPFGPEVQYASQKAWDDLEIRVYPGADGQFILYEDEGDNYNYERNIFSEIPFVWDDSTQTLTIGQRKGKFPGMLAERTFRIVRVSADAGRGDQPMQVTKTLCYRGSEVKVKI
ncbi:MAG: glycoside hydrolase family 31 protein [Bacteroidaceae bacterium]|nr:glycoside hydrolase family 31 protein [Bacteroidaceae bacterium]